MVELPWDELRRNDPFRTGQTDADRVIAAVADVQHGVVARWQLRDLGLAHHLVDGRLARGLLRPLYPGTYAVGHDHLGVNGRRLAAVLAAGPTAGLSIRHAGAAHGLRPTSASRIDVTKTGGARSIPGVRVHRTRAWHADDLAVVAGIPVTSVARTIVDLAGICGDQGLDAVLAAAERLELDVGDLDAASPAGEGSERQASRVLTPRAGDWRRSAPSSPVQRARSRCGGSAPTPDSRPRS